MTRAFIQIINGEVKAEIAGRVKLGSPILPSSWSNVWRDVQKAERSAAWGHAAYSEDRACCSSKSARSPDRALFEPAVNATCGIAVFSRALA